MVAGNAARRKELAQRRKEDRKQEVERRRGGLARASPVEARAYLLQTAKSSNNASQLLAYAVDDRTGKAICEPWFRVGTCRRKRCRYSHSLTISHLSCVADVERSEGNTENKGSSGSKGKGRSGSSKTKGRQNKGSKKNGSGRIAQDSCLPPMACRNLKDVHAGGQLVYDRNVRNQRQQSSPLLFVEFQGDSSSTPLTLQFLQPSLREPNNVQSM